MRARYPDTDGYVGRDGVKVFYEIFGEGDPAILLMPTWAIIHSRMWKAQVPYLARHHRVVTFDPRGNGRSSRPTTEEAYAVEEYVADAVAVLEAAGVEKAVFVGLCSGARWSLELAAAHPEKVLGIVALASGVPRLTDPHAYRTVYDFDAVLDTDEGWAKENRHFWLNNWRGYVEFFFSELLPEPHSTKQIEDAVAWGTETTAETMLLSEALEPLTSREEAEELCRRVSCPVLVIQGSDDRCQPHERGSRLAELTGGSVVTIEGGGHLPHARDPVKVNRVIKEFVDSLAPPKPAVRSWTRAIRRPKRALFVSSPIGLGHARRDAAIASELRRLHPGLQIDWLAQHPVTKVLNDAGESIHPASAQLANESSHIESESAEHDLHAFQAIRAMDEILVANFMVFHDLVQEDDYDVWIADEGWELDYFLHENPELKRAAYVWLTDFVGWVPMPDGGEHEAELTADYNAEMIEHIDRFKRIRDRAIFVGGPDDIVPRTFGPDLPAIRDWTEDHFDFSGYITGFDQADYGDRDELRAELGYAPDEKVCLVTVGGSGVGEHLLRRVIAAYPQAKAAVPDLRMIAVSGPRIDPESLPASDGLEIRGYVSELYRHLAACDLAVVQGGLTTSMELTAAKRPFLSFPLRHHFEQNVHVRHRIERYGAGRFMDYGTSTPDGIAAAIAEEIGRAVEYRDVETDGASRAAALIAEVL